MVFETIVADILNRFLGDFIDNLDPSQLNVGIWGGDVKLNNLEIKETALDELDLPIKLKFGFLDKLVLKIPWKNLYMEPVLANIDGLYLIAVPNKGVIYNKEKADKRDQETKQKELLRLEENRKNCRKPKDPAADTFTEKMIAQVIKNLQVTIKNIHIRFEDKYTNRQRPYVAGVTLEGLNFQTTNEKWKAAILDETIKIFHKLISMQNLAVYWNSDKKFISDLSDKQQIRKALEATITADNNKPADFKYILQLITMEAKLALNQKPESDGSNWSIPKIDLNVEVKELALSIGKFQYQDILLFLEAQERFNTATRYLKYRPNLNEYRGHYREWWHFAYQSILEEIVRRKKKNWSWKRMKAHRKLVQTYERAWIRKQTEKNLGQDVQKIIEKAERELDVFNLNIARQQAEMKIDRKGLTRIEDQPPQGWTEWAKSWWDGSSSATLTPTQHIELADGAEDVIEKIKQEMTPEEKQKLYEAIDYHENVPPTDYPKEYVENKIRVHLTTLAVIVEGAYELHCNECSGNYEQTQAAKILNVFFSSLIVENRYETNFHLPKQKIMTELKEFAASLSYNDLLILYNLYHGVPFGERIIFEKLFFTAEELCFSFLDEFHAATIPMLRLVFSTIQIKSHSIDKLLINSMVSSDYFNQRYYEWEPFLEPWKIQNFRVIFKDDCIRFWLKSDSRFPLDFIVTQTFIKQLKSAYSKWPVQKEDIVQEMQAIHRYNIDGEINIPAGFAISLVNNTVPEELVYARFQGVQMNFCRVDIIYIFSGHVNCLQIDNQLLEAEKWQFLYCHVNALKGADDESTQSSSIADSDPSFSYFPSIKIEISYTPMENYDAFDCFRIKLCDMCIFMDEILLWKLVQFYQDTHPTSPNTALTYQQTIDLASELKETDAIQDRKCYFGTLDLEVGNIAVTVLTVTNNGLSKELELIKRQSNIKLVSFENAIVKLPPFHLFRRYFESFEYLVELLTEFYMIELQKQTLNIVFTMDAFGNPRGLAADLKESLQGLVFEADIPRFVYGLGYGFTNSLSKVASSMSHCIGSLTFDEQHDLMRRRMMRTPPSNPNTSVSGSALSHFANGIKGFGLGVFGGFTAIGDNISKTAKKDGIWAGVTKGFVTGVMDTVTKPTQGVFDLLGGTASAVKEVVGNYSTKKSRFPQRRLRATRIISADKKRRYIEFQEMKKGKNSPSSPE